MPLPARSPAAGLAVLAAALTVASAPARAATPAAAEGAALIVDAWARQPRDQWGTPIDPVSGRAAFRYSQATLAAAALGLPAPTRPQLDFAEHLIHWLADQGPHVPPSVFEIGAAADAYGRLPASSPARPRLLAWLRLAPERVWIKRAGNPLNRWMVEAEGALARCRIAGLAGRARLCALGRTFVERTFPAAARRWTTDGVTVMSDPDENPIAYHHLTLGYFAHALARLPRAGAAARRTLVQMARGSVAIAAPDGEAAYWGRSQGQAWALAFGAYGLRRAQRYTTRAEAARFERTARRMLARYRAVHQGGPVGLAIVPAYRDEPLTQHPGTDAYANVATYAGLTAMALAWLARTSPTAAPAPDTVPTGGHAQDRGNGAFATAAAHGSWLAVRAHGHPSGDPRYDFGLVAAKHRTARGWVDLVRNRPVSSPRAAPSGPLLTVNDVTGRPDGERVRVTPGGTVVVTGGWRRPDGSWLRRARFVFRPTADGVLLTVPVRAGDRIALGVFARDPQVGRGFVQDGAARTTISLPGSDHRDEEQYASASDRRLSRVTLTAQATRAGRFAVAFTLAG